MDIWENLLLSRPSVLKVLANSIETVMTKLVIKIFNILFALIFNFEQISKVKLLNFQKLNS